MKKSKEMVFWESTFIRSGRGLTTHHMCCLKGRSKSNITSIPFSYPPLPAHVRTKCNQISPQTPLSPHLSPPFSLSQINLSPISLSRINLSHSCNKPLSITSLPTSYTPPMSHHSTQLRSLTKSSQDPKPTPMDPTHKKHPKSPPFINTTTTTTKPHPKPKNPPLSTPQMCQIFLTTFQDCTLIIKPFLQPTLPQLGPHILTPISKQNPCLSPPF